MNVKRFFLISVTLLLIFSFSSCSKKEPKYKNNAECRALASLIEANVTNDASYDEYDSDYLKYVIENTSLCDDYCLIYSSASEDINEFGVLRARSEEDAKELLLHVDNYLANMREEQRAFISSYAPMELPKLDNSDSRRFGSYVIYAIADKEDIEKTFSAIANALA